jgi:hypothetical protein
MLLVVSEQAAVATGTSSENSTCWLLHFQLVELQSAFELVVKPASSLHIIGHRAAFCGQRCLGDISVHDDAKASAVNQQQSARRICSSWQALLAILSGARRAGPAATTKLLRALF